MNILKSCVKQVRNNFCHCPGLLFALLFSLFGISSRAQVASSSDALLIKELFNHADAWYHQSFDSVLKFTNAAIEIAKRNEDAFLEQHLDALLRICWCSSLYNRLHETRKFLNESIELLNRHSKDIARFDTNGYYRSAIIFTNGMYFFEQGNYQATIRELSKVVPLSGKALTNDRDLLFSFCSFLGQSFFKIGNYDKAFQYYEMGLRYRQKPGIASEKNPMSFLYEGQYNFAIGKTSLAFELFQKALDILTKENTGRVKNTLHSNYLLIAGYYMKSGQSDSAVSMVTRSINIAGGDPFSLCISYCTLGEVYYGKKMTDSAGFYFTKALNLIDKSNGSFLHLKYRPLWGIANIERDRMTFTKAAQLYNQALANIKQSGRANTDRLEQSLNAISYMNIMVDRAQMYFAWYNEEKTEELADTCIATLERALTVSDMGRRTLFRMDTKEAKAEVQSKIADIGIDVSFRAFESTGNMDYLWKAYAFIEKNKGNILHDKADDLRALSFSGIPEDILENEKRIKTELNLLETQVLNMKDNKRLSEKITDNYNTKIREYMIFTEMLEKQFPRYYNLKYDISIPESHLIRDQLTSRSLLIHFHVSDTIIYALAFSRKSIEPYTIKRSDEFDRNLKILLDQISDTEISEKANSPDYFRDFCDASGYIYRSVLEPIILKASSKITELIIIPEGELLRLPFELLLTGDYSGAVDYSELPYLIKNTEVRYEYSVSLLCKNFRIKHNHRKFYLGFAPEYNNVNGSLSESKFGSLVAGAKEIESCRSIWDGESWTGLQATESMFRKQIGDGKIVHLGTHTIINDQDPSNSFLAFSSANDENEDGRVNIFEIYNLDIPADLAILSGCETGTGLNKKGEGIMSLARAFKYAGCSNIIISLWKVNDKAASEIMIAFNRNLKKGMSKDRALQKAKISFLEHSAYVHPAYWSSFVLIGNDEPLKKHRLVHLLPLLLSLIVLAIYIRNSKV